MWEYYIYSLQTWNPSEYSETVTTWMDFDSRPWLLEYKKTWKKYTSEAMFHQVQVRKEIN